jgi:hypothetical protein
MGLNGGRRRLARLKPIGGHLEIERHLRQLRARFSTLRHSRKSATALRMLAQVGDLLPHHITLTKVNGRCQQGKFARSGHPFVELGYRRRDFSRGFVEPPPPPNES